MNETGLSKLIKDASNTLFGGVLKDWEMGEKINKNIQDAASLFDEKVSKYIPENYLTEAENTVKEGFQKAENYVREKEGLE